MQSERGFEYGVKHLLCPKSGHLCEILATVLSLSEEKIRELLTLGSIYVMQERTLQDIYVHEGQHIRVHTKPRRFPILNQNWQQSIIFENQDFLIFNKPSGHPCHPTVDNIEENLITDLKRKMNQPLFLTHRLDVPTSGLLLLAKNSHFQSYFNQLLQQDLVVKKYRARCEGQCRHQGLLQHWMEPSPRAPKHVSSTNQTGWIECRLIIESVAYQFEQDQSILMIQLLTGRTHQIRSQLAALGHPIIGDHMYGAKKISDKDEIDLTSVSLEFENFKFELTN